MKKFRKKLCYNLTCIFITIITTLDCVRENQASSKTPVDYVNPHIGGISHLLASTRPTVHLPNSMLRFTPITTPGISDYYLASKITGFPINCPAHRSGRHVMSLMPMSGDLDLRPERLVSEYDHDFETTTPYFYSVLLENDEIQVAFAPNERSGYYRFNFSKPDTARLILRAEREAEIHVEGENVITGFEAFDGIRQYVYVEFNPPFSSFGVFENSTIYPQKGEIQGENVLAYVSFALPKDQFIDAKYGISYISIEQAKENLRREIADWSIEKVKISARNKWNDALGRITVRGGTEDEKTVFYTALYRCLERMVNISEYGKYYSAYGHKVHQDARDFYVDDWSWDTYRALHPLRCLIDSHAEMDMVQSYIRMYQQSGWMPTFPQVYGDMRGMIGHHQAAIIADAWFKGLEDFDLETAYEGLRKNAMEGTMIPWREGPATELDRFYREKQYFPALAPGQTETVKEVDPFEKRQAVAVTLEHAYDDWCLARIASVLNKKADGSLFGNRALNYKNVYNPITGFMSPKNADGGWIEPFDPKSSGGPGCRDYFAEVSSWTYTFSVQHDVHGLIGLMGGAETFISRLDQLFEEPWFGYCKWQQFSQIPDGTGLVGQFVMGNEQGFHVPYLYVYAGAPWKTQKRIRQLVQAWFRNDLMGICGDEDGGGMSAWIVFTAMGFYPVCPGSSAYVVGTPLFNEIRLKMSNGKFLIIKAVDNSAQNKYIQSATLNGQALEKAWFMHEDIANGGELVFHMGPRPNKKWGAQNLPPN